MNNEKLEHETSVSRQVPIPLGEGDPHGLQQIIITLATLFINMPVEKYDSAISEMLKTVGTNTHVDRVYIFEHDYFRQVCVNTHEWCAEGIPPEIDSLKCTPFAVFADFMEAHKTGQYVYIPSVEDMPKSHPMRSVLADQDIQSAILYPLLQNDTPIGFVGFDSVRGQRFFTPQEIDLLKILAEIIANALLKKQSETKRQEAQEFLNKIVDSIADPIFVKDEDHRWIVLNEAFCRFIGCSREELLHKSDYEFFPREQADVFWEKDKLVFESGMENINEESITDVMGKEHIISTKKSPFTLPGTDKKFLVGSIRDITDQKRAEEALRNALAQARAATTAKSQFLANMSHEIRTPMNGVLGMASLLATTPLNDEQKQYVEMLRHSGERMMTIINDILDISRIEAGKMQIASEPMNLSSLVHSVLLPIAELAKHKEIDFCIDVSPDIPGVLRGDPARIGQILTNLVGNAVKFTAKGEVAVRCCVIERNGGRVRVRFTVSDTGIGIPPDKLEHLFDPFFQVDGSDTREYGGAGLGLSISRQLTQMMGGELVIESIYGKRTTCKLDMPFLTTTEPVPEKTVSDLETMFTKNVVVLLVEDDTICSLLASAYLKKLGLTAHVVRNGLDAIQKLQMETYDLVLMDCQMPVMDGYETTRAIRRGDAGDQNRSIPIIAQTAYAMTNDEIKCLESGMNDYISKPLDYQDIVSILNKWLPSRKS